MTKGKLIKAIALIIDVAVPLGATISQFPIWVERSAKATVSGLALLFILLSVLPFIRQIREYFKSPAVWVVWGVLFLVFYALSAIIDEMVIISFFGLLSNLLGELLYKYGEKIRKE